MTDKYQEANKRWRESDPKHKAHSNYLKSRTSARSFIRTKATMEDVKELRTMIKTRESLLKIIDLKDAIERAKHDFPQIVIYDNKAAVTKVLRESVIEEEEDMDDLQLWIDGLIGRFDDKETIIEIDLGNGEPRYFAADEWKEIDAYTN